MVDSYCNSYNQDITFFVNFLSHLYHIVDVFSTLLCANILD